MVYRRRKKTTPAVPKKRTKSNLIYSKGLWVVGSTQIKTLREKLKSSFCPVSLDIYEDKGMKQPVLDHQHDGFGLVRGVLSGRINLWEGRCWKYFKKLFKDKSELDYADFLIRLGTYLKQEPQQILHGAIIEAEKRRLTRWRNETIYNKLLDKGLTLDTLSCYTKPVLVELWLNQFIKEKEEQLCSLLSQPL